MVFDDVTRDRLTAILREPGNNGIMKCSVLRAEYKNRHKEWPCSKKSLHNAIVNNWPGASIGYGGKINGPRAEYAVWINSITCLLKDIHSDSFTLEEIRMLYKRAYKYPIPLDDRSLRDILQAVNIFVPQPELKPLSDTSILREKYIPQHLKDLNRHPTALQWNASKQRSMDQVITLLAKEFIPDVSNGNEELYKPNPPSAITPNLRFALEPAILHISPPNVVDLDETDSIQEYVNTFRYTVKLEYEQQMRLYEHYSLYQHQLKPLTDKTVRILIPGIMDARPSLSIADIVLLRPIQPVMVPQYDYYHALQIRPNSLEIQSRIVDLKRGRNNEPDSVVISWELDIQQKDLLKDDHFLRQYNIRFVPNEFFPQQCNTALGWLQGLSKAQQQNVKDLLFPVVAPMVKPLTDDQKSCDMSGLAGDFRSSDILKPLNKAQASFLRMIRARTLDPTFESIRPVCILTGPAGTGKTKALISTIADVLGLLKQDKTNKNRILLCAPSHAAADVLTERLTAILRRDEIFRMYSSSRPSTTVPGKILPFTVQIPGSDTFTLPSPEGWTKFRVVVCTCMDAHILYRAQLTNYAIRTKRQCFVSFLRSNNTIGLNFGGSEVSGSKEPFFTHLFVDEAGQATEPEVLCPMSVVLDPMPGEQKVEIALIGDPRQLSPRIYSEKAALHGLGRSFMERILKRPVDCIGRGESHILGPDTLNSLDGPGSSLLDLIQYYVSIDDQEQLTIFLTENYRGHPSFLMMPSSLFYYDRLRSAKDIGLDSLSYWIERLRSVEALTNRVEMTFESSASYRDNMDIYRQVHRQSKWPIHFRAVKGKDTSVAIDTFTGTDSWQNNDEADVAVEIVDTLIQNGVAPHKIGVMSPFRGQVVAIRKRCRAKHHHDVNVGTIENFQGVEQDVIIFSLTRSNPSFVENDMKRRMGVFGMPKQANVALTRAENLFIVIGNPESMWDDQLWRQWLLWVFRNGLWYGEALEEWDSVKAGFKNANFASMLEQVDGETNATDTVVVSTMEKIHRVHSTNGV
ncbi:hypothetical protein ACHAWT_010917 [Skeletonema menzelii]